MSEVDYGEQAERDWEDWLGENGYEPIRIPIGGEYYKCAGGHIWHVTDLDKLYNEERTGR